MAIDEQRFDPMNPKQEKGDELLKKSLVYERAKVRIEEAAQRVAHARKAHLEEIAATGEAFDESYDVAFQELTALKNRLGAKADEYWARMEACTEKFGPGLERLANAVLANAAYDYEAALCGGFPDSKAEMHLIEKFAECGAEVYTTLNFMDVLDRIRRVYFDEWLPKVREVTAELRAEPERKYLHKCPLCGGGLYYVHCKGQSDTVRCTTCGLFERVKKEKKRGSPSFGLRPSSPAGGRTKGGGDRET